jgi:FkbH-like protein
MKITEALRVLKLADKEAPSLGVLLACGFTPLHLQTFLTAHLQLSFPNRFVMVTTGIYGNLANTLEKATEAGAQNIVIVIEWADIDSRLGYRTTSTWDSNTLSDVVSMANFAFDRLRHALDRVRRVAKVVMCPPTLPLPPLFGTAGWEAGLSELTLSKLLADFNATVAGSGIPVVNLARLAEESPAGQRHDLKSDLTAGLPYSLAHADAVALALSRLLCPPGTKKGLITDLDDTLWSGTVGEVGPDGIHWDLDRHSHIHALYQNLLTSLSDSGVLLAVASKNDPDFVHKAFEREDLLLRREKIFPVEVHWNAKSTSVSRILRAWNISADAVVFVDDSPLELAEVAAAHPGIECIQFSAKDYNSTCSTLRRIRDIFGKSSSTEEDSLRLESIRQNAKFQDASTGSYSEVFLRDLNARIHIEHGGGVGDTRALELVNKTNQFNLNGVRFTESDWAAELSLPRTSLMTASYEDKFGKLGKISAILGRVENGTFRIRVWVMSCRAFSRQIEYHCLQKCFDWYSCLVSFDFEPTLRNRPFQDFLRSLLGGTGEGQRLLTRERFEKVCPPLYQTVDETRSDALNG